MSGQLKISSEKEIFQIGDQQVLIHLILTPKLLKLMICRSYYVTGYF